MAAIATKTNRFDHFAEFPAVLDRYQEEVSPADRETRIRVWNEVSAVLGLSPVSSDRELLAPLFTPKGTAVAVLRGNTFPIKGLLKKYGFRWDGNESEWIQASQSWEIECLLNAVDQLTGAADTADGWKDSLVLRFRDSA